MNIQSNKYIEFMKFFTETNYYSEESINEFVNNYHLTFDEEEKIDEITSEDYKKNRTKLENMSFYDEKAEIEFENKRNEEIKLFNLLDRKENGIISGDVTFNKFVEYLLNEYPGDYSSISYSAVIYFHREILESLKRKMIEILNVFEASDFNLRSGFEINKDLFNVIYEINSNLKGLHMKAEVIEIYDLGNNGNFQFEVRCPNLNSYLHYILSKIFNDKSKLLRCAECQKIIFHPSAGQIRNMHANNPVTHEGGCRIQYNKHRAKIRKRNSRNKEKDSKSKLKKIL